MRGGEREGVWVYELFQETKGEELWALLLSKNFPSVTVKKRTRELSRIKSLEKEPACKMDDLSSSDMVYVISKI